jgi:hypothetical protein
MNNYDYDYDIYSNIRVINYYNPYETDVSERIDVSLRIFDEEYEYAEEYEEEWPEEGQRMSIEAINLTQQMINEEEPVQFRLVSDERPVQLRLVSDERINSYLSNGDELIETCSICLDDVVNIESTSKLSCRHHFHTNCIKLCLERNNKCPLCRKVCLRNE